MSIHCRFCLALLIGLLFAGAAARGAEVPVTVVSLEDKVYQWVVDEASARIFASLPEKGEVAEFDPATGKQVRRIAVGGAPEGMVIKRHWLVVADKKATELFVVDLKENKPTTKVSLPLSPVSCGLFCSKADNSYVYAIWRNGESSHNTEIVQVDLRQMKTRKQETLRKWQVNWPTHVVMSPDGRWLVADSRGKINPTQAGLMSVVEETFTCEHALHHHNDFRQTAVSPSGQWWTLGERLYPKDLKTSIRQFRGAPVAIHPTLDLVASLKGETLMLDTFSESKPIAEVSPDGPQNQENIPPGDTRGSGVRRPRSSRRIPSERGSRELRADPTVAYDLSGNRVIWGVDQRAFIMKLADLPAKLSPRVEIVRPTPVSMSIQKTHRMPLAIVEAGESGRRAKFSIAAGPKFASIEGNELVLSPGDEPGKYELKIQAALGEATDAVDLTVEVGQPHIPLGFQITALAVDREGKRALVGGRKKQVGYVSHSERDLSMDLAVVDLATAKVVSTNTVSSPVEKMAIDDKYVYIVIQGSNVLHRLDCTDLTKRNKVFLEGTAKRLAALPKGRVAVVTADQNRSSLLQVYDRETLQPTAESKKAAAAPYIAFDNESAPLWEPIGDGAVCLFDRIVDAETGALRCVLDRISVPLLPSVKVSRTLSGGPESVANVTMWGRSFVGLGLLNARLQDATGSAIASINGYCVISPTAPVLACFRSGGVSDRESVNFLDVRDLKLGEVVWSKEVNRASRSHEGFADYYGPKPTFVGDQVLLPLGDRLFLVAIPDEIIKKLPTPLCLKYPKIGVVGVDKPLEVQLEVVANEGKVKYELLREYPGIELDADSGKVTIDLPRLWNNYVSSPDRPGSYTSSDLARTADYRKASFLRATGQPLPDDMLSFSIPLAVMVSDAAGQKDRLLLAVVGMGPLKQIEDAREARAAEMRKKYADLKKQREQTAPAEKVSDFGRSTGPSDRAPMTGTADSARLEQMEIRMRRLETTFDAILRKLDRIEQSLGARPPAKEKVFHPADGKAEAEKKM